MNKNKILISLIPIVGSLCYSLYLFMTNRDKSKMGFLCFLLGVISFIVVYGGFAIVCNIIKIELKNYMCLVLIMLYLSGFICNVVYFLTLNKKVKQL